jgi:hypothetical protein
VVGIDRVVSRPRGRRERDLAVRGIVEGLSARLNQRLDLFSLGRIRAKCSIERLFFCL